MKHAKKFFFSTILSFFLVLFASPAIAQEKDTLSMQPKYVVCGNNGARMLNTLANEYKENPLLIAKGMLINEDGDGSLRNFSQIIVLWNEKTTSYTIGELLPGGAMCILASGDGLELVGKYKTGSNIDKESSPEDTVPDTPKNYYPNGVVPREASPQVLSPNHWYIKFLPVGLKKTSK